MRADREDGGGGTQQQQAVVMRLRHVGRSDALDHQLHAELVFIQHVCQRKEAAGGVKKKTEQLPVQYLQRSHTHLQRWRRPLVTPCGRR